MQNSPRIRGREPHVRRIWTKWLAPSLGSRIGRNSLYSTLGYAIPALATLIFTPLLLHGMGPSDFGLWTVSISFVGLMGIFDLGLSVAMAKYIAQYREQGDAEGVSATATMGLLVYLAIGLLLTVPAYILAPFAASLFNNSEVPRHEISGVLRVAAIGLVPLLLKNAGLAVSIGLQRFKTPMVISVVQSLVTLSLALAVTQLGGSVMGVVASSVLTLWLVAMASILVGYKILRSNGARPVFSRPHAFLMLKFTTFTGISGLGSLLFNAADRIAVGAVLGVSAVAYYTVSVAIASNLLIVADVLTRPLMPAASSWSGSGQWERIRRNLERSTLAVAILELTLGTILLLVSRPFMTFWLGANVTAHALTPFRILILTYAVVALFAPAYQIANGSGLPWIPAVGALVGGLVTVILIVLLARTWGLPGAAWANCGYWANVFILVWTARVLKDRASGTVPPKMSAQQLPDRATF